MSLIIATGSNLGDSLASLNTAKKLLQEKLQLVAESRIYRSAAVDYENQPDFLNQVLEFHIPASWQPEEVMQWMLEIEQKMGRKRDVPKGPRTIDLDIIFWGLKSYNSPLLTLPHPRWNERSFIVYPLRELPFFQTIEKCFTIPRSFKVSASPLKT